MIKVNYNLSRQQLDKLKILNKETGITISEHIRRAVDAYLDRKEEKDGLKNKERDQES